MLPVLYRALQDPGRLIAPQEAQREEQEAFVRPGVTSFILPGFFLMS